MSHEPELIQLSDLPHGRPARLAEIRGGRHLARRLLALGLRQGSALCVVQRRGQGLIVAVGEVRIAVGAGIADKLWVTSAAPVDDCAPCVTEDGSEVAEGEVLALTAAGSAPGPDAR